MMKALKRAAFQVSHRWESVIAPQQLETLAKNSAGDVRCAVNCLRFFMLKKGPRPNGGTKISGQAPGEPPAIPYEETLGRDCSVALFHAVGKMCYNKRLPATEEFLTLHALPPSMSRLERHPMKSEPEEVVSTLHMDGPTFNLFVHQNYLNFFENVVEAGVAASYASDADIFLSGRNEENERMWEYSTSVFCRGMLFAREDQSTPSHSHLYKPEYFRVQKNTRESQHQLDEMYTSYLESFEVSPFCHGAPVSKRDFLRDFVPATKAVWNSREPRIPDFIRKHKSAVLELNKYTSRNIKSVYLGHQVLQENGGNGEGIEEKFDDDESKRPGVDEDLRAHTTPAAPGNDAGSKETRLLAATIERKLYLEDDDIED